MSQGALFKQVLQVGMVVRDLEESLRKYWEIYGIGPWAIYTMDPSNVSGMTIRGERADHAIRVAFTMIGGVQWELIQPLDDRSIYAEFLKAHGEGLHHVAMAVEDYEGTVSTLKGKGIEVLQGGTTKDGLGYAYLDTAGTMKCITEIYHFPEPWAFPAPEATYP